MSGRQTPAIPRGGARGIADVRPPMVWTAALLCLFGGIACLVAPLIPISPAEPTRPDLVIGTVACVLAVGLWLLGARLPPAAMQALMMSGTVMVSVIVATAKTSGGVMLTAFAYPWIAIYIAHFYSRRAIFWNVLLISAGFRIGVAIDGLPNMDIGWLVVTGTVWSTSLVLSNLSNNLRYQADTDPLTGLLNRNGFLTAAYREKAVSERSGHPLTLAVLDLDGFKQVNDLRGHAAGDSMLADLGRLWKQRLRAGDIIARHGGDEFVLLLPSTAPAAAAAVLNRLHVGEIPVTWSIGISEWLPRESLDACMARADRSLYSLKESLRAEERPANTAPRPSLVSS
ncbi:MAG TPA: GGDEF domain-containing protein [Solirubrobacteraceae bacterium]|nr:GGDEF domain-containing protein [Solirubrobacteraceae bacterium]